jgi:hypothetical protein
MLSRRTGAVQRRGALTGFGGALQGGQPRRACFSAGEHTRHTGGIKGSIPVAPAITIKKRRNAANRPSLSEPALLRFQSAAAPVTLLCKTNSLHHRPIIEGMDWMMTIPLIVGAVGKLSALALQALAERLLTIVLAALIISGVSVFALTGFVWLWIKHAIGDLHARPSAASHL